MIENKTTIKIIIIVGIIYMVFSLISLRYNATTKNKEVTQYILSQTENKYFTQEYMNNVTGIRFHYDWDYEKDVSIIGACFTTIGAEDIIASDWLGGYYVQEPFQYLNVSDHYFIDFEKLAECFPNTTAIGIDVSGIGLGYDHGMWFSSFKGIDNFSHLQIVDISLPMSIKDISSLANVKTLRYITLHDGLLFDISSINDMPDLEYLRIYSCRVSKIGKLNGLPKLQYLDLENNRIRNANAIANCKSLKELRLRNNRIKNTDFTSQLPLLKELYI